MLHVPIWFMKHDPNEPTAGTARASSPPAPSNISLARESSDPNALSPQEKRRHDIDNFLAAYERIAPDCERRDGWTPFLRKLFLQVIAETGKIGLACEATGMS